MTEKEYIDVRDLACITCCIDCLKNITPAISDVIPNDEYNLVRKLLHKWELDFYKIINTHDTP